MTGGRRTSRGFLFLVAAFASFAALVMVVLVYPQPISAPELGAGWQCRATVFLTSCTRVPPVQPAAGGFVRRAPAGSLDV